MSEKYYKIRQKFSDNKLENVEDKVKEEISNLNLSIKKDSKIAVAVGSRGIANISNIVKTVVESVKNMGGAPFIVPAMGSHGGATDKGQIEVLESLGITEEYVGAPIHSSMEVVELPSSNLPCSLYMDKYAHESDGVILINRIKPHSDFHAKYESGLVKMSVIGLGKHKQALEIHNYGVKGLKELTPQAAEEIFKTDKVLFGLAIVENALDETLTVKALTPEGILKEEPKLLNSAKKNMPSLPIRDIDILIVDELGKDISGTGLDPNIIGRMMIRGESEPDYPNVKNIILTDLTEASHGNANGIGFADFITKNLYDKVDFGATYENIITSTFFERAKIPLVAQEAEDAYNIALRSIAPNELGSKRVMRIKNTLHLDEIYVSESIYAEIKDRVETISELDKIFNCDGSLIEF